MGSSSYYCYYYYLSHTHIYYANAAAMLARPAGHEAKDEARKSEAEAEAEARHVTEQLSVYEQD